MKKVLIVEDNEAARIAIRHTLEKKFKLEIREAKDGVEGLTIFSEFQPDLIMLDVAMPIMNGKEFLEALRSDPTYHDVMVMVLTAYGDKQLVREMIALGISDYILKPFEGEDIARRVRSLMTRHSAANKKKQRTFSNSLQTVYDRKILLVEADVHFTSYFMDIFGDRFNVITALNGAEGLSEFVKESPAIVILGKGLSIINERLLARKIAEINNELNAEIYLLNQDGIVPEDLKLFFDGAIIKSTDQVQFVRDFSQKILGFDSITNILKALTQGMREPLVDAVKQTLGVANTEEVYDLDKKFIELIPKEVVAIAELLESQENIRISLFITGARRDLISISSHPQSETLDKSVMESLGEHIQTISNRIRQVYRDKGILTTENDISVQPVSEDFYRYEIELQVPFKTDSMKRFLVGIAVTPLSF